MVEIEETITHNRKIREIPASMTVFYGKKSYHFAAKLSVQMMEKLIDADIMDRNLSKEEVLIYAMGEAVKRIIRDRKQESADTESVDALIRALIEDLQ